MYLFLQCKCCIFTYLRTLFLFPLQEEAVDYRGYQGWDKVDALGRYLLTISGSSITEAQLTEILRLQSQREDSEKQPIRYFSAYSTSQTGGRFGKKNLLQEMLDWLIQRGACCIYFYWHVLC